jgi:hypothetical protein
MGLEWASIINGVQYRFRVDTKVRKGKMTIYVNDFPIEVKRGLVSGLLGFDEQFVFDGIVARLIVHGRKKADVVINGLHLQSGLPYRKAPAWSWIFIILCVALIINGGALPVALGFLGAYACARVTALCYRADILMYATYVPPRYSTKKRSALAAGPRSPHSNTYSNTI